MARLEPQSGVSVFDGRFVATSDLPWLTLSWPDARWPTGWLELHYVSSFHDDPVRPILRLTHDDGRLEDIPLPAPVLGRGIWLGWVPRGVTGLSISPVASLGPFTFAVEHAAPLSTRRVMSRALCGVKRHVLAAGALAILGKGARARRRIARAILERPVAAYDAWRRPRLRAYEAVMDAPKAAASRDLRFQLNADARGADGKAVETTVGALLRQVHANWRLTVDIAQAAPEVRAIVQRLAAEEPRITMDGLPLAEAADIIANLRLGDRLVPMALALVADRLECEADADATFGDVEIEQENGSIRPLFLPAWSNVTGPGPVRCSPLFRRAGASAATPRVSHIRRILCSVADWPSDSTKPALVCQTEPQVSVIIPTRDRLDLLRACLDGVLKRSNCSALEVIVVDNDSREPDTKAYLAAITSDRVKIVRHPGAFNFSAICNRGAALATGETLIFLNNDVTVKAADWLQVLTGWAQRADVGAVGPLLFYPDGRLQHAGVVIGPGGAAGHVYAGCPPAERGVLNELDTPREVAAVTGACLAVSRNKFEAVGGFDAENFAVTLNDIDLCLRLREKGWRTVLTPQTSLIHHESATRRGHAVDDAEVTVFRQRWAQIIRDDPHYHPAFSLASLVPVLG